MAKLMSKNGKIYVLQINKFGRIDSGRAAHIKFDNFDQIFGYLKATSNE